MLGLGIGINKKTVAGGIAPVLEPFGTPAAAYSLRYIYPTIYNGDVILVRRSSDNAEQGFTPEEITGGTLTTFTGAGDGFVKTWYDQSGNGNDVTQSVISNQPKIVDTGSIVVDNGLSAIDIYLNSWLDGTGIDQGLNDFACFMVLNGNTASDWKVVSNGSHQSGEGGFQVGGNSSMRTASIIWNQSTGLVGTSTLTVGNNIQFLHTLIADRDGLMTQYVRRSGSTLVETNSADISSFSSVDLSNSGNFTIGRGLAFALRQYQGKIQELIFFNTDKSSERANIEANIAGYYGITLV